MKTDLKLGDISCPICESGDVKVSKLEANSNPGCENIFTCDELMCNNGHTFTHNDLVRDCKPIQPKCEVAYETVNHPNHYNALPVECIDVIEHFDFVLGSAIKYIWRAGLKPGTSKLEDLRKALWYLERAIANEEKANGQKSE